jgi:hypothetical protein
MVLKKFNFFDIMQGGHKTRKVEEKQFFPIFLAKILAKQLHEFL